MSLSHSTNYLLVSAMLVLLYVPNNPKVIITTSSIAVGITTFSNILLT